MPKLRRKSALKRKDESKLLMREARQTAETERFNSRQDDNGGKDAQFKSRLDEESLTRAKKELNEDAKDRICAVQSFRNLILQEKWLKTPTGDAWEIYWIKGHDRCLHVHAFDWRGSNIYLQRDVTFLLRFLRYRKFSQLSAKDTLENYWTIKTKYPAWFVNLDPTDTTLQAIMRTGFYYSPIKPDKWGRRFVIEAVGKLDINDVKKKYGADNVFRAIMLICEWLKTDEHVQVNGILMFIDCTSVSMQHHLKLYTMENIKKMIQFYQNSMPSRNKGAHIYNEPPFFDAVWALISPLLNEKTRNRMFLHGKNLANVYDTIDVSVLPEEYLPDEYTGLSAGATEQIVEEMIGDMLKPGFRSYIKDLTSNKYGVDLEMRKQSTPTVESFRRLNID